MRLLPAIAVLVWMGCTPAPPPPRAAAPRPDPASESWYEPAIGELAALNRQAESLLKSGLSDQAAVLITRGQTVENRLLSASRPPLAAMEAASDLDDLYARMLLANRRYGWARMSYQKNWMRWKRWQPQTEDTARRMKAAASGMAECDRRLSE